MADVVININEFDEKAFEEQQNKQPEKENREDPKKGKKRGRKSKKEEKKEDIVEDINKIEDEPEDKKEGPAELTEEEKQKQREKFNKDMEVYNSYAAPGRTATIFRPASPRQTQSYLFYKKFSNEYDMGKDNLYINFLKKTLMEGDYTFERKIDRLPIEESEEYFRKKKSVITKLIDVTNQDGEKTPENVVDSLSQLNYAINDYLLFVSQSSKGGRVTGVQLDPKISDDLKALQVQSALDLEWAMNSVKYMEPGAKKTPMNMLDSGKMKVQLKPFEIVGDVHPKVYPPAQFDVAGITDKKQNMDSIYSSLDSLCNELAESRRFMNRDQNRRGEDAGSDSYQYFVGDLGVLHMDAMKRYSPKQIIRYMREAHESATRYVEEHTGFSNMFKATIFNPTGRRRLNEARHVKEVLDRIFTNEGKSDLIRNLKKLDEDRKLIFQKNETDVEFNTMTAHMGKYDSSVEKRDIRADIVIPKIPEFMIEEAPENERERLLAEERMRRSAEVEIEQKKNIEIRERVYRNIIEHNKLEERAEKNKIKDLNERERNRNVVKNRISKLFDSKKRIENLNIINSIKQEDIIVKPFPKQNKSLVVLMNNGKEVANVTVNKVINQNSPALTNWVKQQLIDRLGVMEDKYNRHQEYLKDHPEQKAQEELIEAQELRREQWKKRERERLKKLQEQKKMIDEAKEKGIPLDSLKLEPIPEAEPEPGFVPAPLPEQRKKTEAEKLEEEIKKNIEEDVNRYIKEYKEDPKKANRPKFQKPLSSKDILEEQPDGRFIKTGEKPQVEDDKIEDKKIEDNKIEDDKVEDKKVEDVKEGAGKADQEKKESGYKKPSKEEVDAFKAQRDKMNPPSGMQHVMHNGGN